MNIFINYADNGFYDSQKFGCESALLHGFDEAIDYRKKDSSCLQQLLSKMI